MAFKLKSLMLENFVVFQTRTTVEFSRDCINLVFGSYLSSSLQSNGAGKSLLIDGISLALFGKGIRSSYISDYISKNNQNGGIYVGLEIIDENNNLIKVERWKRPNSEVNKAKLWKNGVCISQDMTITRIDEAIRAIVGIDHTNFLSTIFSVMLPGFTKLRPSERFERLEQSLAVKRIESVVKKINTAIKSSEESISSINYLITDKNNLYIAEATKKEIYCSNIETIKSSIKEHEEEIQGYQKQEHTISEKLYNTRALISECNTKLEPFSLEYSDLSAEKRSIEVMKSGLEIKKKAVLKSFKTNKQGNLECSICKSSLTEHSKEAVKHHYDDELTTLNVRISEVSIKLIEKLSKIDKIKALKDQMEKTATKLSSSLSFVQTNLIALERALSNNKESLELASSAFNEELLLKLKKELIELRASLKEHEKQLKINVAWKQIVSKNGLRLSYIKEEINVLNALASQYATIVYEKPMQVKFFINDEKDNPTLDFTINGRNSGMFSTGEKGRLEISMTLSLLSLLKTAGFNMSVLVLDEALDGLSEASKLAVLKVVDSLSHEYQIILISHDELVKTKPGYAIQVIKDGATETSTISTAIQKFEQV